MSYEHPVNQPITSIIVPCDHHGNPQSFIVGLGGVTKIEATTKSGMHADIPYVRVWTGDVAIAEFCQHAISATYFGRGEA